MKLHQDREAFGDLISDVSRRSGIRSDIIDLKIIQTATEGEEPRML